MPLNALFFCKAFERVYNIRLFFSWNVILDSTKNLIRIFQEFDNIFSKKFAKLIKILHHILSQDLDKILQTSYKFSCNIKIPIDLFKILKRFVKVLYKIQAPTFY